MKIQKYSESSIRLSFLWRVVNNSVSFGCLVPGCANESQKSALRDDNMDPSYFSFGPILFIMQSSLHPIIGNAEKQNLRYLLYREDSSDDPGPALWRVRRTQMDPLNTTHPEEEDISYCSWENISQLLFVLSSHTCHS